MPLKQHPEYPNEHGNFPVILGHQLDQLIGCTITGIGSTTASHIPGGEWCLLVTAPNGHTLQVWIQSDAEGNDSGWLEVEED